MPVGVAHVPLLAKVSVPVPRLTVPAMLPLPDPTRFKYWPEPVIFAVLLKFSVLPASAPMVAGLMLDVPVSEIGPVYVLLPVTFSNAPFVAPVTPVPVKLRLAAAVVMPVVLLNCNAAPLETVTAVFGLNPALLAMFNAPPAMDVAPE